MRLHQPLVTEDPPTFADPGEFFGARLPPEALQALSAACAHEPEFRALVETPSSAGFMLRAVEAAPRRAEESVDEWIVQVTARYLDALCEGQAETDPLLTTLAHDEFLLGECPRYDRDLVDRACSLNDGTSARKWLVWSGPTDSSFTNTLVCHYFVARGVNLVRFEYPHRWVLMFLAVLTPGLVARMTAIRGGELRAEIEEEVAQRVQSALSHQLKRSAGAVRSNLKKIRSKLSQDTFRQLHTEYDRILQESQFQIDLAERTGLWSAQPELRMEPTALLPVVEEALVPLREKFAGVDVLVDVPSSLSAHADARLVREIVFCLAENAFHAVYFAAGGGPRRIEIRGLEARQHVRLEVRDSGPGVHPEDSARIFEPRVTTKKGGEHQPLGTGMGLPIARRYARLMDGDVDVDPGHEVTRFFVELRRPAPRESA